VTRLADVKRMITWKDDHMKKQSITTALFLSFAMMFPAYPACNDTRVLDEDEPGTDAGTAYACQKPPGSDDFPSGSLCVYSVWGDIYKCGPQGTGEQPTGQVCSCQLENRTVKLFQGTCNGQGACSNGVYVITLERPIQRWSAILTCC